MAAWFRLAIQGQPPLDLPPVLRDYDRPRVPVGGFRTTLAGAEVSQIRAWRRAWTLNFGVVTDATLTDLELWLTPAPTGRGPAPYQLYEGDNAAVLVHIAAFTPKPAINGLVRVAMTLREVGL